MHPVNQAQFPTKREREVIDLIAVGLATAGIAEKLYITENTVRSHVRNVMDKLGARTRAHLVALVLCDQPSPHESHAAEDGG